MFENPFYLIITIAVVAVCLMWLIVLHYLIKIFKKLKHIAEEAENELKKIVKDVEYYREDFKAGEKEVKLLAKATAQTARRLIK